MVFSQSCSSVMPGAKHLLATHDGALQNVIGYVQPVSSGFSLPVLCSYTTGSKSRWKLRHERHAPKALAFRTQGNIRIQCFLEERGRGGDTCLTTGLQKRALNYETRITDTITAVFVVRLYSWPPAEAGEQMRSGRKTPGPTPAHGQTKSPLACADSTRGSV